MIRRRTVPAVFYPGLFAAGIATFILHEAAHGLIGTALGYDMVVTLNGAHARGPTEATDQMLISAAGPVFTVIQGLLAFLAVRRDESLIAFALLFSAAFMRLMATGVSLIHPNDESRVSLALGLGGWTLPIIVVVLLGGLTLVAGRALRLGWTTWALAWVTASLTVTAIVGLDRFLVG